MNERLRQSLLVIIVGSLMGLGVWAFLRYQVVKRLRQSGFLANQANPQTTDADMWARAVEKVKEDRGTTGGAAIEIPTQLRHYEDRHWFLATQVAEVEKFNVQSCQDFVDLAGLLERGEFVSLPAVTESYILFGVGAKADDGPFSRFEDDHNIAIYDETELRDAYARLDTERVKLQTEISDLRQQSAAKPEVRSQRAEVRSQRPEVRTTLKKAERSHKQELQKEIATRQQELQANTDEKAVLDHAYGQPASRQALLRDYESLQTLAKNFAGRSFNLDDAADRYALKVSMLSSLRPQAVKILEEVAQAYHEKFARPLPVSSLVRPEQYQHALRKVNRNAVLIDTPPHSTGLAFDIDYRYMSGEEQNFLMTELARLKDEGRIEVIRERNANYHVFAFVDGKRPADQLITASLEQAGAPPDEEANHATAQPAKPAKQERHRSQRRQRSRREQGRKRTERSGEGPFKRKRRIPNQRNADGSPETLNSKFNSRYATASPPELTSSAVPTLCQFHGVMRREGPRLTHLELANKLCKYPRRNQIAYERVRTDELYFAIAEAHAKNFPDLALANHAQLIRRSNYSESNWELRWTYHCDPLGHTALDTHHQRISNSVRARGLRECFPS
jgi:hypothetical protein